MTTASQSDISLGQSDALLVGKVFRRLIPFLILCFLVNYIDRTNISMAQYNMERTLLGSDGATLFPQAVFDFGLAIFYIPYCLLELPSVLIQGKVGHRKWIARIMISWGLVSSLFFLTQGPRSFYTLRILLGICEAGFFPGIILYLASWVPKQYRARAKALFFLSTAFAQVIGNLLGGLILYFTGKYHVGAHPWQWLFIVEGIPSIIMGVIAFFYLTDRPQDAKWLSPDERTRLATIIEDEHKEILAQSPKLARAGEHGAATFMHALKSPATWLLSMIYIGMNLAYYPVQFYTPKTLKNVLHDSGVITLPADVTAAMVAASQPGAVATTLPTATPDYLVNLYVGALAAIPFGIAAIASLFIAGHSDRQNSRKPHIIICSIVMAAGLIMTSFTPYLGTGSGATILAIAGISTTAVGWFGAFATFWSLPAQLMTGTAVAAAVAIVNSLGNLMGNFVGPNSRKFFGDHNSLYFAASWAAVAIVATLLLRFPDSKAKAPPAIGTKAD